MVAISPSPTGLALSTQLSGYYVKNFIAPHEIARILNAAKVPFLLAGAHGINVWLEEPRATQDVDIVVAARQDKKAVRLLLARFPHLIADDHEAVIRLREPDEHKVIIDVMKAVQPHLRPFRKHSILITREGVSIPVPTIEMALALKFAPMVSPTREEGKKLRDAGDFVLLIKHNPEIDLKSLHDLGDLVYPGGGQELVEKVRQVRAGGRLRFDFVADLRVMDCWPDAVRRRCGRSIAVAGC